MPKQKHPFHALNKRELLHLMDSGVYDLAGFERIAHRQATSRQTSKVEPCWECRAIAQKLNIPIHIEKANV